ncbi:SGNH/GDSL hydrolase family protein, partial [Acinetobacter baumannii]|nr:SGNH/GDSL hydrolase family protein [Acinetobacter baumannii]
MAQQTIVIEVPGKSISELEPTSSVSPNDVLPVVQGEETKKAPLEQVADLVKAGLGSAALKNVEDFAIPSAVTEAEAASQARDDAQNERIDSVEHGLVSIGSGADASFST